MSFARIKSSRYHAPRKLHVFSTTEPLSYIAIALIGLFMILKSGCGHVFVLRDRFYELTLAVPLMKTISGWVTDAFFVHWAYAYGVLEPVLSNKEPQFMARHFENAMEKLGFKYVQASTYKPLTNRQAKIYNSTLVSRLQHYVTKHQRGRKTLVQRLTYAQKYLGAQNSQMYTVRISNE